MKREYLKRKVIQHCGKQIETSPCYEACVAEKHTPKETRNGLMVGEFFIDATTEEILPKENLSRILNVDTFFD